MKVLVTGGAGFIGSNFVRMALNGEFSSIDSIKVLDKLTYAGTLTNFKKDELEQFEFIHGDICDGVTVSKSLRDVSVVINFAAESHVDRSIESARDFVFTNVLGTQTLLENSMRSQIEKYVQISTDEVYGSIEEGSWDEDEPLLPNSPYAASKASGDLIVNSYNKTYGLDTRITRCSNNYGAHQYPEKLIPFFISRLLNGQSIPVYGDGMNVRDWLHVTDHCRGIYSVLTKGEAGNVYNIGGGTEVTNLNISHIILKALDLDESRIEYVKDRLGHDRRYSVSWGKIAKQTGYSPQVSFENGIIETIDWYLKNRSWWEPLLIK